MLRDQGGFRWDGVAVRRYEGLAEDYAGVTRQVLSGAEADAVEFETRYFEVAPGGFTRLERHGHAHVVVVMRGAGEVLLGDRTEQIEAFDCVYVAPGERHQFRAHHAAPLGFLCVVDRSRVPRLDFRGSSRSS